MWGKLDKVRYKQYKHCNLTKMKFIVHSFTKFNVNIRASTRMGNIQHALWCSTHKIQYIEKIGNVDGLSIKVYKRLIKAKNPKTIVTRLTKSNSGRGKNMGMPKFDNVDQVIKFLFDANGGRGVPHKNVYNYMIQEGWTLGYKNGYLIYTK